MSAAVYHQYGAPEVLQLQSVPKPAMGENDVSIRVRYSTVTRTDCGFLRAKPFIVRFFAGLRKPKANILGCEFAGEVVAKGSAVSEFQVGDRVFGFKDDDHGFGGHAQYTNMPSKGMLAKIPDHMTYPEVVAGLEGAHYALYYIRSTGIGKGSRVLINGATGAIGSAALQIACAMGAEVTAVCAKEHERTIQSLGAVKTIDYKSRDFTELDEKFDVVFDAVGKSTYGRCRQILTASGIYTSSELGPFCQNPFLAFVTPLFCKRQVRFPIPNNNSREDAEYIESLLSSGKFTPLVDRTYSLENIRDAFTYVETGEKIGNVLIEIP